MVAACACYVQEGQHAHHFVKHVVWKQTQHPFQATQPRVIRKAGECTVEAQRTARSSEYHHHHRHPLPPPPHGGRLPAEGLAGHGDDGPSPHGDDGPSPHPPCSHWLHLPSAQGPWAEAVCPEWDDMRTHSTAMGAGSHSTAMGAGSHTALPRG